MSTSRLQGIPSRGIGFLPSSSMKLLACFFMLIDHTGMILFPSIRIFRIIGRLAFPIFAYFIAEGCRYTRNKLKHFLQVAILGVICEAVYVIYKGKLEGNILLTFSLSILVIYALQFTKAAFAQKGARRRIVSVAVFAVTLVAAYILNKLIGVDYGFVGILIPVLTSLFHYDEGKAPRFLKRLDRRDLHILMCSIGLLLLVIRRGFTSTQAWCLAAIPFLFLYNGKPGVSKIKYGFYIFYPAHLLALEGISMLIKYLSA